MSDTYQPIYDATRSRMSNGDIGSAIESVMRDQNISFYFDRATSSMAENYAEIRDENLRPSVLMKPAVFSDGNMWCALYGVNLQEGVCGFGATPDLAARDFDKNWLTQRLCIPKGKDTEDAEPSGEGQD